ncbi:MAG: hypothetical protein FRX49_02413 [Trebouxia sp. A1-2]|nr:MAG: hypothetical protein FRX49_02413 [Trebouxia sp. A1-2]
MLDPPGGHGVMEEAIRIPHGGGHQTGIQILLGGICSKDLRPDGFNLGAPLLLQGWTFPKGLLSSFLAWSKAANRYSIWGLHTMMMMTMLKKMKKRKHADLDAVNDGLDVVGLCAQLWLPYFCCPGSNAVAHGPYGFRANPHCLQAANFSLEVAD